MRILLIISILFFVLDLSGQGTNVMHISGRSAYTAGEEYPSVLDDGNTEAWYIADASYMTEQGDSIITWEDKTTNNNDLGQYPSKGTPSLTNDSVHFDPADADAIWVNTSAYSQPVTIYAVIQLNEFVSNGQFITLGSTFYTRMDASQGSYSDSTQWDLYAGAMLSSGSSNLIPLVDRCLLTITVNSTSSEYRINNRQPATGDAGTNATDYILFMNSPANASVSEVIIRTVDDSSGDETSIRDYLNNKYTVY